MRDIMADEYGEIAFGALRAGADRAYGRAEVSFNSAGFDEMDEVRGSGCAKLLDDGSLEMEFNSQYGDDVLLKAARATSSAAC